MKNRLFFGLLAISLPLLSGCASIGPGEVGVKTSMGIVDKNLLGPGISVINPILDDIDVVSLKQTSVAEEVTPLTSDQQPITIKFNVQYKIPQAQVLNIFTTIKGDAYTTLVLPQIQEAFRQVVSKYKADYVIANVNTVKNETLAITRSNLRGYVTLVDLPITHTDLPEALKNAILEKQKMEILAKQKVFELQREQSQAQIVVTKAKAEAEATTLVAKALTNSPKFVELKKVEAYNNWIEKWNGVMPTIVAGDKGGMMLNVGDAK